MKTELILVGKTTDKNFETSINNYVERLSHYTPFSIKTIPALKSTKNLDTKQIKNAEGEMILKCIDKADTVVLLDEHGKEMRSVEFADWVSKKRQAGRNLTFVIGGAYGFSDDVYKRANEKISLSKMTFSHQMVRLIFVEQLYRACTIINGEPYHHE